MTGAKFAGLRRRLVDGETVTVADVVAVNDAEAAAELERLQAEADEQRAQEAAEACRVADVAAQVAAFAADADRLADRMEAAGRAFDAACDELAACAVDMDAITRKHVDALHRLDYRIDGTDVPGRTGGRVIIARDMVGMLTVHDPTADPRKRTLPAVRGYVAWARTMQAKRGAA
jgi:hypothetical protein